MCCGASCIIIVELTSSQEKKITETLDSFHLMNYGSLLTQYHPKTALSMTVE
jgi:hypothetical protein